MTIHYATLLLLLLLLSIHLYTEVKNQKLTNIINVSIFSIALVRLVTVHPNEISLYLFGLLVGLLLPILFMKLFNTDEIGGGVIKLLSSTGLFFGAYTISIIFIFYAIIYSIFALIIIKKYKKDTEKIYSIALKYPSGYALLLVLFISVISQIRVSSV